MRTKICIIITVFNPSNFFEKCLDSIVKTGYKDFSIIIYDDGSNKPIKKNFLKYKMVFNKIYFLRSSKNIGFAKANNRSLKFALKLKNINYFLLLNSDAYISNNFFLKSIPYLLKNYDLISPIVSLTKKRGLDSDGIDYYTDGTAINRIETKNENFLVPGACLFVKKSFVKESFNKFGWLFIPILRFYIEDVELSLRAILMKKKLYIIPHRLVYHDRSSTNTNKRLVLYYSLRNQLWTIMTTWTNKMIRTNLTHLLKGQFINTLIYSLKFKNLFMAKIYGETLFNISKLLTVRKLVQKNLLKNYPEGLFQTNSITFQSHIKESATYRRIKRFLFQLN